MKRINLRTNKLINDFLGLGLKKGDKVAFLANNCHEFVEGSCSVAKVGLVSIPVNARISDEGTSYVINHSDSVALIYHKEFEDKVAAIRRTLKNVNRYTIIGSGNRTAISFESLLEGFSG